MAANGVSSGSRRGQQTGVYNDRTNFDGETPINDAMALHEELMEACADLRGCEARVMGLLARMASTRGYLALGYTSLISYAEDRLQLPVSTARAKVLLADRLTHLPRLREQVESGSWAGPRRAPSPRWRRRRPTRSGPVPR